MKGRVWGGGRGEGGTGASKSLTRGHGQFNLWGGEVLDTEYELDRVRVRQSEETGTDSLTDHRAISGWLGVNGGDITR